MVLRKVSDLVATDVIRLPRIGDFPAGDYELTKNPRLQSGRQTRRELVLVLTLRKSLDQFDPHDQSTPLVLLPDDYVEIIDF